MAARGRKGKRQFEDNGFGEWGGYMAAKKAKLEEQFSETKKHESVSLGLESKKGIFDGVSIFVNGYTEPTADELKRIMMVHGGVFHHYQSSRTTHIIAKNLPDVKVKALKGNEVIVKPSWITDSLKENRLLDYKPYLLITANQRNNQPQLEFKKLSVPEDAENDRSKTPALETVETSNKKTLDAKDEKFMGEFYNNSRLHLISSMKSHFKNYVTKLRNENKIMNFPERQNLTAYKSIPKDQSDRNKKDKIIMHIDMDCFFVSVSLKSYPDLRGKPVGVAHAKGNKHDGSESWSEIASCSYEARTSGVKNGMFVGPAKNICPDLKIIPYDFEGYKSVAQTLYDTVSKYTLDIQAVSCDEMLVDLSSLSSSEKAFDVIDFGEQLRKEIFETTACTASIGMGPNVLLAKLATKSAKPNGIYKIDGACDYVEYMKTIEVRDLPGVGRKLSEKLKTTHSVSTCEELQQISIQTLKSDFGVKTGQSLYDLCRGKDDKTLDSEEERKSVSAEINYGIRFTDIIEAEKFIGQLSDEVCKRLHESAVNVNLVAKQVTLKIMTRSANAPVETRKFMGHGICDSFSKSANMSTPTNEANVIKREAMILLKMVLQSNERNVEDLRGIGIQLTKFEKSSCKVPSILKFINKNPLSASIVEPTEAPESVSEKPEKREGNQSHSIILSLSQIDQDTLDELPIHIKEEIMKDVSSRKHIKRSQSHSNAITEEPSTSAMPTSINANNLSFSQIDPDVLSELPIEIQKELRNQFSSKATKPPSGFDKIMPVPSSKQSNVNPKIQTKRKKGSPRTCKNSNKSTINAISKNTESKATKCLFQNESNKMSLNSNNFAIGQKEYFDEDRKITDPKQAENSSNDRISIKTNESSENDKESVDNSDERIKHSSRQNDSKQQSENVCSEESDDTIDTHNTSDTKPVLGPKNSIEELRPLLRKWTRSFVTPTYDDVETISNYFTSQISEKNVELVYFGLKSLCRNCLNSEHPENWTGAYNGIVREVQRAMLRSYGKRLSVNFKF